MLVDLKLCCVGCLIVSVCVFVGRTAHQTSFFFALQTALPTLSNCLQVFSEVLPDQLLCQLYYNRCSLEIAQALLCAPGFASHSGDLNANLFIMSLPEEFLRKSSSYCQTYRELFLYLLRARGYLAIALFRNVGVHCEGWGWEWVGVQGLERCGRGSHVVRDGAVVAPYPAVCMQLF